MSSSGPRSQATMTNAVPGKGLTLRGMTTKGAITVTELAILRVIAGVRRGDVEVDRGPARLTDGIGAEVAGTRDVGLGLGLLTVETVVTVESAVIAVIDREITAETDGTALVTVKIAEKGAGPLLKRKIALATLAVQTINQKEALLKMSTPLKTTLTSPLKRKTFKKRSD